MLNVNIKLEGRNIDELIFTLKVVKRLLEEGYVSGKQQTMQGSFQYGVEGEEEEDEDE